MKKFMKALALALALCMVLSVSAFAAVGAEGKDVDTDAHTVAFTVTGVKAEEQVALLILKKGVTPASATENDVLFIDQTEATASGAAFNATIAEGNDVVDVYVGSSTINSEKSGAWKVYPNLAVAVTNNITIASGEGVIEILNIDGDITRPGAAIKVNFKNVPVDAMIWALWNGSSRLYSAPVALSDADYASLDGDVWFTGVFSSATLAEKNFGSIRDVAVLFHGTDDNTYYVNIDQPTADADKNN